MPIGLAVGVNAPNGSIPRRLFAIAGSQSNGCGHADGATLSAGNLSYLAPYPNVGVDRKLGASSTIPFSFTDYGFQALRPRELYLGASFGNMGVELSMSRTLDQAGVAHDLVMHAVGGIDLAANLHPDSTSSCYQSGPNLFWQAIWRIQARAYASRATVSGIAVIQGEADATNGTNAGNYQTNLTREIAAWRAIFGANLPIVIVRCCVNQTGTFLSTVRTAQAAVVAATTNCAMVNTDDLALQGDSLHYTADAYITLGQRIAAAFLSLQFPAIQSTPAAWTVDATSGKPKPRGPWEWANFLASIGITPQLPPTGFSTLTPAFELYCDDPASGSDGNMHDCMGNLFLTAANSPTLQSAVSGWSAPGVLFNGTTQKASTTAGFGWNTAGTGSAGSVAVWFRASISAAPVAERELFVLSSGAPLIAINRTSDGKLKVFSNSVTTASANAHASGVFNFLFVFNKTAGSLTLYTSLEKLTGLSYAAPADGTKGWGGILASCDTFTLLDGRGFIGADAEQFSTSSVAKAFFIGLGDAVAWS